MNLDVCEVCGEKTVLVLQDIKETEPVRDGKDQLWATWKSDGIHSYCDAHKRAAVRTYLPETSFLKIERDKMAEFDAICLGKVLAGVK